MSQRLPQIRLYTLTTAGVDELAIASGDTIRVRRASTPAAVVNVTFEGDAQSFTMMLGERFGHAGQACRIRVAWTAQAGEWLELIVGTADAAGAFDVPAEAAVLDEAAAADCVQAANSTSSPADITLYTVPAGRTLIIDHLEAKSASATPYGEVVFVVAGTRHPVGRTYNSMSFVLPSRWRLSAGSAIKHNNQGAAAIYTILTGRLF